MRTDCKPLAPCRLCEQVPGRPDRQDGVWVVRCPLCGRTATGALQEGAVYAWNQMQVPQPPPLSASMELLDAIEAAMCDLEAIRQVPGAMTVWHRWQADLDELRGLVKAHEAEQGAGQ